MALSSTFEITEPARADIDVLQEATVLEFGAPWCGHCNGAKPLIAAAFARHPQVRHIKVEDGAGRPLGRSYRVKLWPTLIFLSQGQEVARLVRPMTESEIADALAKIDNVQQTPPGKPRQ